MENISRLEVHYHLRDGLHTMDALVRNRCEAEFLSAVAYITQSLGATLQFEATVPTEGGFRDIWQVAFKAFDKENRSLTLPTLTALLVAVLGATVAIWNAPPKPDKELERQQLEINRLTIEHWKLENQNSELQGKKLKRELDTESSTLSLQTPASSSAAPVNLPPTHPESVASGTTSKVEPKLLSLQMDPKVRKPRSNFYKQLISYEAVTAVGFRWLPGDRPAPDEQVIFRSGFPAFLLQTDILDPESTEAVIEIVSPVITEGDIQWRGRWNGQTISFAMNDKVFKDQVFHRQISFQHGDSIRCVLQSDRKLDEEGSPKVTGHRVLTVLDKIESTGGVYETAQGRRKRFEKKHADGQSGLFDHDDV